MLYGLWVKQCKKLWFSKLYVVVAIVFNVLQCFFKELLDFCWIFFSKLGYMLLQCLYYDCLFFVSYGYVDFFVYGSFDWIYRDFCISVFIFFFYLQCLGLVFCWVFLKFVGLLFQLFFVVQMVSGSLLYCLWLECMLRQILVYIVGIMFCVCILLFLGNGKMQICFYMFV